MHKLFSLIALSLLMVSLQSRASVAPVREKSIQVRLGSGTISIDPLSDNSVRIRYFEVPDSSQPVFVFTQAYTVPGYTVKESENSLQVQLAKLSVVVDKKSGAVSFFDGSGRPLLREIAGSRIFRPDVVMGEPCYFVEQRFHSDKDEALFGLGQFQDGHYQINGISRRLTQVNSQIAIPFIYSSKGYGLLWHQYGLTDFNPADEPVALQKVERGEQGNRVAEVTTTAGTQRVSQNQSLYEGSFSVPRDGDYSVFLDLGGMGNRHYVVIDGKPIIDQNNMWLPPTAGALVSLKAGSHKVQLICKSDNKPRLTWKEKEDVVTFRSPHAKMLDYVILSGSADEVVSSYRALTGPVPMFPKWAYGFWQCRERYTSAKHLVETVQTFRERKLPMDVIVQDWQYWGSRGWGVPQFDAKQYPDPAGFIGEIHKMNAHFNISIWSNPDQNSEIGKQYVAKNRFIPGTKWLDYYNPETRKEYWNTLKVNMFDFGVDSWWMDAVEPENDALTGEKTFIGPGDLYRLTYPLMVSKAVYEGQRETTQDKRVCILTRSAFLGQQRYGVINWSGDIGGDWDTYRRQIVAGLNFTITGLPYWTTDIGGFFRPGQSQYSDPQYHELLVRWFQWGALNPIFRMHGYMTETEPWKYGSKVEESMRKMLNLRYRLLPYIYSEAWKVSNGSTLMRPLVMDFASDHEAMNHPYLYMFGKSFLVAPVTEPGATQWSVYLPGSSQWFDFRTGKAYTGGKEVTVDSPFDEIPLFVKAGAIVPLGREVQNSAEAPRDSFEIRIYGGADGTFTLYDDEGDNYNYEKGNYTEIPFAWSEASQRLTIGNRKGEFAGLPKRYHFRVMLITPQTGSQSGATQLQDIEYSGKQIRIKIKPN